MRLSIHLNDGLLREARRRAADDGIPLRDVIETALRQFLRTRPSDQSYRVSWHTESGRLLPGVDLNRRDALTERMDGRR